MGKGQGIGHGNGGHVEQAVDEKQGKKAPKMGDVGCGDEGGSSNEVAEGEKAFGGKVAVGKLIAEKNPQNGSDSEHGSDQTHLPTTELQHPHVGEDFGLPGSPDGNLQQHHDEKEDAVVFDWICFGHLGEFLNVEITPSGRQVGREWTTGRYSSTSILVDEGRRPDFSHWSGRSFPALTVYFPSA